MVYYPSNARYEKANLFRVSVAFNRKTEPDLVAQIEAQQNKAGYLKQLVKDDIERNGDAQEESKG